MIFINQGIFQNKINERIYFWSQPLQICYLKTIFTLLLTEALHLYFTNRK